MTEKRASRRRRRGFTIIELLLVLVIIGITALVGSIEVNRATQRAKLEGTANNLRNFLQGAVNEMQRVRCPSGSATCATSDMKQYEVFAEIAAQNADGSTDVYLYVDDNSNGLLDVGSDREVGKFTIAKSILLAPGVAPTPADALYTGPKTQVASLNWGTLSGVPTDADKDDVTTPRGLKLDFKNRAISTLCPTCTSSSTILTGIAKLSLTAKNMTTAGSSSLTPLTTYEIWISPVWNVTVHKGVWDGTKFVY